MITGHFQELDHLRTRYRTPYGDITRQIPGTTLHHKLQPSIGTQIRGKTTTITLQRRYANLPLEGTIKSTTLSRRNKDPYHLGSNYGLSLNPAYKNKQQKIRRSFGLTPQLDRGEHDYNHRHASYQTPDKYGK